MINGLTQNGDFEEWLAIDQTKKQTNRDKNFTRKISEGLTRIIKQTSLLITQDVSEATRKPTKQSVNHFTLYNALSERILEGSLRKA